MSLLETSGVVIKVQDYKENDKLVWLFTEKFGKITCIAKGAKKSKSKLFSVTQPLCYAEYMVFKGKNLFNLREGKIQNSFGGLMSNLEKLTYASYLSELIDIALLDGESNSILYKDFLTALYLLNTDAIDYELLIRSFELRLLKATGYGLMLDNCAICRKKIKTANYISLSNFGGICEECPKNHGLFISKGTYNALRFLSNMRQDKIYMLNLSDDIKREIAKVTTFIISSNYAKKPKSLEMLNYLKE